MSGHSRAIKTVTLVLQDGRTLLYSPKYMPDSPGRRQLLSLFLRGKVQRKT